MRTVRTVRTAALIAAIAALSAAYALPATAAVTAHVGKRMHKTISLADPLKTAGDGFGQKVAVDASGTEALVSAYGSLGGDGRVYLYRTAARKWSTKPAVTFAAPLPGAAAHFGFSVALSPDGTIAYVGADHANVGTRSQAGAVYIYKSSKGVWPKKPSQTINDPGTGSTDYFGVNLAVSSNGGTLVVGAPGFTSNATARVGRAYVYTESNGKLPTTPSATLASPTPSTLGLFGYDVSVSDNKSGKGVAVVGAYDTSFGAVGASGAAYIFDSSGLHTWKLASGGRLRDPGNRGDDFFGGKVAVDSAGTLVLIGAQDEMEKGVGDAGAAFAYRLKGSTWKASQTLVGPANGPANFSYPAISSNGAVALACAPSSQVHGHQGAGVVFPYGVSATALSLGYAAADPTGGSANSPEYFGSWSALNATGTVAVIGAPATGGTGGNNGPGVAYVYSIS